MTSIIWLLIFWGMQILAHISFAYGSELKSRWLVCFIVGNAIGVTSIWVLMKLYTVMPINIALALGAGGGFLFAQIALAVIFKTNISFVQYIGAFAIAFGMGLVSFTSKA